MEFSASDDQIQKPHAVCIPFPAQGHVSPMLKLAMLLHHKGFHITFVNTEFNHRRLLKSRGSDSLDGLPGFCFETIPDGLPPSDENATQDPLSLCMSTQRNCLVPLLELLEKLNCSSSSRPPVSCVIQDGIMSFAIEAAEKIGVPSVCFRTSPATILLLNKHYRQLEEKGLLPSKDGSSLKDQMNNTINWIPGIKSIQIKDIPSFFHTTDPNDQMVEFEITETERCTAASAIIFNSYDSLESDVLRALSPICPPIYTIGPLQLLVNQLPRSPLKSLGSNLWKEDADCLKWLDTRQADSVIYVNYGSVTVMTPENLVEFAWGLASSNQNFLFVIRPDLVVGNTAILPKEFLEETKDRGLITGWCPQGQVLSHRAVGGFLTHCGWNSMTESLINGVPLLCWPFFADQPTNCKLACNDWGVGVEIEKTVRRNEVAMHVRELMQGEKGKVMRKNAMEWKRKAEEAVGLDGSSTTNLEKLVKEVLLSNHKNL
ncbi:7-deoxyloganetin glucosyltransferase [Daucus carota subsp. sativus]|uniref:7-deoxyloganetin glucosyltransferase n=1 Tax=Daucus carota subsp. sativus TaxID=79200 RepID=UPI0007EF41CF|nr:PREDICTED: 7-deoxyloganetin glucosyltransferase-like [Daucus carota subsp. sativus]